MPVIAAAAAAAVTWVGGAAAAVTGFLAAPLVGVLGEGLAISVAGGLLKAGASLALSAATSALFTPRVGAGGSPIAFKADPSAPIFGVMGRFGVGGRQLHANVWGKDNLYISFAVALSLGPIQSVEQFTANGNVVTFPGSQGLAAAVEPYKDKMWQTYRLGLPTDAALLPPSGVSNGSPAMSEWTSSHTLPGFAQAFWTMQNNSKRASYESGVPAPIWTLLGMKVWDPRLDSTYPGGSGSQRRDRWDTWAYSANPYLHALAWVRGHAKLNTDGTVDRTKRLAGVGAPDEAIDIAAFVEGANVCDANDWTIAGEWTTADDKWQVLAAMLQAGGGVPLNRGAQISCMVEAPRTSLLTLTGADIVGSVSLNVMASRRDRPNTIVPRVRLEAQKFEEVALGAVTSSTYLAEDGGEPRTREVPYRYVGDAAQGAQLAAYGLANARETLKASIPCKPHLLNLRAGDAFTVNEPELGLNGQKFVVVKRAFDPSSCVVTLDVRSETDGKHAFALGQVADAPATPSLTAVDPVPATPDEADWTVTVRGEDAGGTQQPGLVIAGTVTNERAASVILEYALAATGPWSVAFEGPPTTTSHIINGLQPGEDYWVAVSIRSIRGVPSAQRVYGPFTVGDLVALSPEESEALNRVNIIDSDNWLSRGEKGEIIRQATTINVEYTGIAAEATALGITTPLTAYANAIQALNTYLDGLTPDWDDVATDTPIVGTAFRSAFQTVYQARQVVLNAITADVAADVASALSQITAIASDSVLARGEKGEVIRQAGTLNAEYAGLASRATALGITTELTDYTTAITTLNSYLGGLSPAWNDTAVDTPIVGSTFRARFNDCYVLKQALLDAMYGTLGTGLSAATTRLDRIAADDWLTRGEKPEVIRQHATLNGEYAGLASLATSLGITTQVTTYFNAVNAVNAYLAGLSPAWNDLTQDTPMTGATLRARFNDAYVAKQAVMDAIGGDLSADVAASLARLDAIANDNLLTRGEKSTVIREHGQITGEYSGIAGQLFALGLTSALNAYNAAYSDLLTYLGGLSPAWNDLTADTVIVGTTFRSKFNDYYLAREAARTAIAARINADAASALARLDLIASDNWLTAGEKPEIIRQQTVINEEYLSLAPRAVALGITTPLTNYTNAIQALNAYLGALSPAWDNLSADTPIVGTTFRANFALCYTTKQIVMDAITADLGSDVALSLSRLDAIASDGILTRGEKPPIIREVAVINGEYTGFATRLNAAGLTTALNTYNTAINALNSYLGGLSPAWNDLTADTVIVGTTFRSKFNDYYLAREAARTAIAARINADAASALARLDLIASDNWLTAGEKPEIIRQQTVINEEYLSLAPRAVALGITTPLTNYTNAIQALNAYLGALSPAWDNLSADTPIVGTTFRANFALCYTTKQIVMDAITADLGSDVALSLSRLDAIASDGILTRGEKPPIIREVAVINGEYTGFATRLNAAGLTTALNTYNTAINALNSYLGGLSPAWNDTTADTTINATTFSNVFRDYYLAKQAGQDAINAQTGGSVSGGFKALSGGFGSLGSSYSFVAQGDFAAFVSGSLAQASALGSGGTFSSPTATGLIGVKVTYQLVSGGTETTIFEQALDVSSDGLDQGGGVYGAVWSGSAVGQAVVALSGAVRFKLYAKLITGTNPTGATGEAAVTATPPAA